MPQPVTRLVFWKATTAAGDGVSGWGEIRIHEPIASSRVLLRVKQLLATANQVEDPLIVGFQEFDKRRSPTQFLLRKYRR